MDRFCGLANPKELTQTQSVGVTKALVKEPF